MNTSRFSQVFKKVSGRVLPTMDFNEEFSGEMLKFVNSATQKGFSLEDLIAGLIVILMNIEGYAWQDFWIIVSKIASKIPAILEGE